VLCVPFGRAAPAVALRPRRIGKGGNPIMSSAVESQKRREAYWKKTLTVTSILLAIWFVVTYVVSYFAVPLNEFTFLGFPFAFYMAAQGSLIVYVAIIVFYAWYMNRLDREYGVSEEG
jgi:putative solute:sodium symporter small subunit